MEVEVVGADGEIESREIAEEVPATAARIEQARRRNDS